MTKLMKAVHSKAPSMTNQILRYGTMEISVITVTPDIARRWLEHNEGNRTLRRAVVAQYARDMGNNDWIRKPVAIAFDQDGKLGNGQHTLNAIIESGKPQELLVARNVERDAIVKMDVGAKRTISDVASFLGESFESRKAAIVRVLRWGPDDSVPRSFDELYSAYIEHKDAVDYVTRLVPVTTVGFGAPVLGPVVRAWYTQPHEKLERFLAVLREGIPMNQGESAAVRLRDLVRAHAFRGTAGRRELYEKTESALSAFIDGRPIAKLYSASSELFPVPGEPGYRKAA